MRVLALENFQEVGTVRHDTVGHTLEGVAAVGGGTAEGVDMTAVVH